MKSLRVTWDVMSAPPQSKEEIALNSPFTDEPNGSSSKVTPDPTDIANVSDIVGDFGPWQRNIFAFFFVCGMFSAWHGLGLAFYAPDIDYWCRNGEWADVPLRAQLLEVKRGYHGNSTDGLQCTDLQGAKCSVWEFDDSQFTRTLTQEFGLVWAMFGAGLVFVLTLPVASSPSLAWLTTALAMAGKFCITASFAIIYLYSAEIFPTVARTVGIGSSSVAARLGAVMAPFIKELGSSTHITVALAIFGLLSIANGLLVLQLPETKGKDIPDTLKEAEDRA
ncbi:Solute carrier family 22 member 5 [Halotydeus destructor]|nr:Solute carrier family 22 member 5 [Halotydeus destructor]